MGESLWGKRPLVGCLGNEKPRACQFLDESLGPGGIVMG